MGEEYLRITTTNGDTGNIEQIKFVNLDNVCTANVYEGRTVLIMNNKDTISLPNTDKNPFWVDCSGSFVE